MIWTLFIFIITISVLVFVHEFGHFLVARLCGVRVLCFSIGFGKKLFKYKRKETEYCISMVPLGGYVQMLDGRVSELKESEIDVAFDRQSILKRTMIVVAGPFANFLFALFIYWGLFMVGVPNNTYTNSISKIVPDSVAEQNDLRIGDKIISYNDIPFTHWSDFSNYVKTHQMIAFEIERGGQRIEKMITLSQHPEQPSNYSLGVYPEVLQKIERYNFFNGFIESVQNTLVLIKNTCYAFFQLFIGGIGLNELSGPISIANTASEVSAYGWMAFFSFLAIISINLGVVNLLPFPILDGGHLLFLLFEKMKGSPLSKSTQERFFRLGFIFLMGIMCIAFFNDFSQLR